MICKQCGTEIIGISKFCPECGCAVSETSAPATEEITENPSEPIKQKGKNKSLKKNILIIAGVVISILVVVAVIVGISGENEDNVHLDGDNAQITETTITEVNTTAQAEENISPEEKIAELGERNDFKGLADYYNDCPEEQKTLFAQTFEKSIMSYLTEHRSNLYTHDIDFILDVFDAMAKVPLSELYNEDGQLIIMNSFISRLDELKDSIRRFYTLQKSVSACTEITGNISNRVKDSANEGEYLNEYILVRSEDYYEGDRVIIYSEEPLWQGYFAGYVRYKTREKLTEDGFESVFFVYEPMSDRETEQYLNDCEEYDDLANMMTFEDTYNFNGVIDIVNEYAKKYPATISDSNFAAEYVAGYEVFSYQYLHHLTLKEDNTFEITINAGYGMVDYSGTYTKEGNLLLLENDDMYFELVINGETLVYHNRMEYGLFYMDEGTVFIR